MDDARFDTLAKTLSAGRTRRSLARLVAGLGLGAAVASADSEEAAAALLNGGFPCTSGSQCKTGKCLSNGTCSCSRANPTCRAPRNRCKKATCEFSTGRCITTNRARGATCQGDGNPCTRDICDGNGNCIHPKKPDGTACGSGTCQGGVCVCGATTCASGQVCCPDKRCGRRCCANGRACSTTCCGPDGNNYCCDASRPVCICGGCWQAGSVQCDDPKHCCGPLSPKCCGNDHCCADGWQCLVGCPGNTCCKGGQSPTCCPNGTPA
jgi:hypothetical protein